MKTRKAFVNTIPDDAFSPVVDDKSMTMPDQSITIQELLERFAFVDGVSVGELMKQSQSRGYQEDQTEDGLWNAPDLEGLDIAELQELAEMAADKIAAYKQQQAAAAAAAAVEQSETSRGSESD